MKGRKSWKEKLRNGQEARLVDTAAGRMLVPRPVGVDALMRTIQTGRLVTVSQIRDRLARDHGADYTCPLTTGIFVRIAAEAAAEDAGLGRRQITPYWRVVKADGCLMEKLPGGPEAQAADLQAEGHTLLPGKGKKPPRVADFEKRLQEL